MKNFLVILLINGLIAMAIFSKKIPDIAFLFIFLGLILAGLIGICFRLDEIKEILKGRWPY